MKLNEINTLKCKLQKAESIRNSINEIERKIKLLKEFGSKVTDIGISYTELDTPMFSPSYEEELVTKREEITPDNIGVLEDGFSYIFKDAVIEGLEKILAKLHEELEEL